MHKEQKAFCERVKARFPEYFDSVRVVDFGSLDVNGNNRYLFSRSDYTGIDIGPGANVNIICRAHTYTPSAPVDVVISTETLEHDEYWPQTLRQAMRILRSGGLFLFTCAKDPRGEHGTKRSTPEAAPHVGDYYRNLSREDIERELDMEGFERYEFGGNDAPGDLYFWGVKI